ncbi:MAG TPA: bifunctional phosphoribosylaminoimidazolecarboxamide formyltransferase/IMP cyclohydrolase [Bacteroidota bacterium]|nr:bifunctional phosphoribosylaminoimidazolecarboxamide formyltransferase/IMP cyclohydrolase [Bacteroidota bacterium]
MENVGIKRALLSVSDKTGIAAFAQALGSFGVEILSTGGTLSALRKAGVKAHSISSVTGFPEIMDGRVKTLHPKIHGGLLGVMDNPKHIEQMREHDIVAIDLLAVNLYPFEQTVAKSGVALDSAVEQIDIGGPAMLRAAAKNFDSKTVVTNPATYGKIIAEMKAHGGAITRATRFSLAKETFHHTSRYDAAIFTYLSAAKERRKPAVIPDVYFSTYPKASGLRYGENPHQSAALYGSFDEIFRQLHGKELSFNNIVDIQAAVELVEEFSEPTVVIIKHTNPCGVGSGKTLKEAYEKALATDSKSAFGGIVAVNRKLDDEAAHMIDRVFTEVVIAPEYDAGTLEFLKKKKDRRLMVQTRPLKDELGLAVRSVAGGVLVQTPDSITLGEKEPTVVTKRAPTEAERNAMSFAWKVVKHVKSNAIVYTMADRTIGIGAGQMSRFDSSRIAALKAGDAGLDLKQTAVASDAFFPFADGLLEAVKAGATAVIQPGGSMRDEEVIRAADDNNIAMLFTGVRHFKH